MLVKKKMDLEPGAEKPEVFDADSVTILVTMHSVLYDFILNGEPVGSNRLELRAGFGRVYKGDSIKHH